MQTYPFGYSVELQLGQVFDPDSIDVSQWGGREEFVECGLVSRQGFILHFTLVDPRGRVRAFEVDIRETEYNEFIGLDNSKGLLAVKEDVYYPAYGVINGCYQARIVIRSPRK